MYIYLENLNALNTMRSLMPVNIATLSVQELVDMVRKTKDEAGNSSYYPLELAMELKNNKLLHWIVTHKDGK
jgi:hypothetical protein